MRKHRFLAISACLVILVAYAHSQDAPHFDHATVYVQDLQKSADFYEKVMELQRIPEPFHDGRHVWFRIGPHDQLHVVQGATAPQKQDIEVHLAFRVPSVPDFAARLQKLGVKYRHGTRNDAKKRPDGVDQIYLQDPDGYWIEVNDDRF
jgi:lactoylglutathione lyase